MCDMPEIYNRIGSVSLSNIPIQFKIIFNFRYVSQTSKTKNKK